MIWNFLVSLKRVMHWKLAVLKCTLPHYICQLQFSFFFFFSWIYFFYCRSFLKELHTFIQSKPDTFKNYHQLYSLLYLLNTLNYSKCYLTFLSYILHFNILMMVIITLFSVMLSRWNVSLLFLFLSLPISYKVQIVYFIWIDDISVNWEEFNKLTFQL